LPLYENLERDRPYRVVHSLDGIFDAYDRLTELTDSPRNIIPSHDAAVFERYPAASPTLDGRAVELIPCALEHHG
jgi:hypothetical protein